MELPAVNLKCPSSSVPRNHPHVILLGHWLLTTCFWRHFSAKPRLETPELTCALCKLCSAAHRATAGLHCILGLLCLGQLHCPGLGCVGCGSAGLHRRHKHVSGWLAGHHLPGHRAHQHLLPAGQPHGHRPLWRGHGHPQLAAQAALVLLRLPHVPGARG
uniref:Angiotensin II receptor associated protein n=1 Tax=Macaca fascicularis TaxID=9541 RepID=A0A2K5WV37_MACFA